MHKTTLYLDEDLDRDLSRLARERGVTKAEFIRSTLRESVEGHARPRIAAIGVFHGPGDVAENVDRYLRETGFGET